VGAPTGSLAGSRGSDMGEFYGLTQ
jgi:hypothetical protein